MVVSYSGLVNNFFYHQVFLIAMVNLKMKCLVLPLNWSLELWVMKYPTTLFPSATPNPVINIDATCPNLLVLIEINPKRKVSISTPGYFYPFRIFMTVIFFSSHVLFVGTSLYRTVFSWLLPSKNHELFLYPWQVGNLKTITWWDSKWTFFNLDLYWPILSRPSPYE